MLISFADYSPPSSPSPAQQRDALQKGLGRAWHWAASQRLDERLLLEACLRDQSFDAQVESSRGAWLWQMIQSLRATERLRVPILHALYDLSDEGSADQLCQLAQAYAEAGDEPFRSQLYEIVAQKPIADLPWLGETEVLGLDGGQGFLFAARVRGQLLADRAWDWDDRNLIDLATERLGEGRVHGLLEASVDAAVRRFRESWRQDRQTKAEARAPQSYRERMAAIPVEAVLRAAGEARCVWLRGWGKHAADADVRAMLQHLRAAREPRLLANLLRVFAGRALPEFDTRLLELCRHGDAEVRRGALQALEPNAHPLVREFALAELQQGVRDGSVVALFSHNYRLGDEHRILEALELPDDECERHWLLMAVVEVLAKNPEADCSPLGVLGYALTPCSTCRFRAARLLFNQQVAPEWLAAECQYDSGEDCRALVKKKRGTC